MDFPQQIASHYSIHPSINISMEFFMIIVEAVAPRVDAEEPTPVTVLCCRLLVEGG